MKYQKLKEKATQGKLKIISPAWYYNEGRALESSTGKIVAQWLTPDDAALLAHCYNHFDELLEMLHEVCGCGECPGCRRIAELEEVQGI